jgi:hypothetical protein
VTVLDGVTSVVAVMPAVVVSSTVVVMTAGVALEVVSEELLVDDDKLPVELVIEFETPEDVSIEPALVAVLSVVTLAKLTLLLGDT